MLFFSRAIADALEIAITIREPRLMPIGTDNFSSVSPSNRVRALHAF
jgi:hypothetical protein